MFFDRNDPDLVDLDKQDPEPVSPDSTRTIIDFGDLRDIDKEYIKEQSHAEPSQAEKQAEPKENHNIRNETVPINKEAVLQQDEKQSTPHVPLFLIGGIVIAAVILLAVAAFVRVKKRLRF
ncbi:MAG: hypothetical protein LBH00_01205 [Planctomycetaceae bacterium]|jgi:hypothetical protein|nr:hypothetical protein [Planctomycetaceae bacterium]